MESQTQSTRVKAPVNSGIHSGTSSQSNLTYDVSATNPSGRVDTEAGSTKNPNKLLRCTKSLSLTTFNARTLQKQYNLEELVYAASIHKLDIVCLQEHRYMHSEVLSFSKPSPDYTLITSSAWENTSKAAQGGIGLLLSNKAYNSYLSAEKISPRILVVSFAGNPSTTIIICYSPHNSSPEEDVIGNVPPHNVLMLCGDFNAKLGRDSVRYSLHEATNRNGEHLYDLMHSFNLIAANCHFQKPQRKLWTFTYPNGSKAQLDYILVRSK